MAKDVRTLIQIAEGHRASWWWPYSYRQQLNAIRMLGDSGSEEALKYLRSIYDTTKTERLREDIWLCGQGSGDCNPYSISLSCEATLFPNAKRQLTQALRYVLHLEQEISGCAYPTSKEEREDERNKLCSVPPHSTFREAIHKLERKLGGR